MADKLTLSLNALEAGCLLGLGEAGELADGRIKPSDAAGNIIIREPYSWGVASERSL